MLKEIREKYSRYEQAVQNPRALIAFIQQEYKTLNRKKVLLLREDFSGSARLATEWVKQGPRHCAVAVDLSAEPLEYCNEVHRQKLSPAVRKRLELCQGDVRRIHTARTFDVIVALNFSYCVFHTRHELLDYFVTVRKSLKPGGLFLIDLFGGSRSQDEGTRKIELNNFVYQWQCVAFNPVRNRGSYAIHFKPKSQKLLKNVFTYDWRIWTCPELLEVMEDAGFSMCTPYWEGDHPRGRGGDGKFTPTEWEENCLVWQSFIVGQK